MLKIFFLYFCLKVTLQNCTIVFNESTGVIWTTTKNGTTSVPLCLDEKNEILKRNCENGVWSPEPKCSSFQPTQLPECPDGFNGVGTICYQFSDKSEFPPQCPFNNVLPFHSYIHHITLDSPIWVPAKRQNLTLITWIEPSLLYGEAITNYTFPKLVKDKECLTFFNKTFILTSCTEKHQGICAYAKLNKSDSCGYNCLFSDLSRSRCFCRSLNSSKNLAEFQNPYQYNIYKFLTTDICSIGFYKTRNGVYVWKNSNTEISYTFWSSKAIFDIGYNLGAATPDGWILTQKVLSCTIIEKEINPLKPKLLLDFNNSFILTVENFEYLKIFNSTIFAFCFSNVNGFHLLVKLMSTEENLTNTVTFTFDSFGNVSADYWCEAFDKNSTAIKSNNVFLELDEYLEFVGIFTMKYQPFINPLSDDINSNFESVFFVYINISYDGIYYKYRIMKIEDLDEANQIITLNVHFTSSEFDEDEDGQYIQLKSTIKTILTDVEDSDISLIDFRSTKNCFFENKSLTWNKTPIGSFATPMEFCFRPDGTPIDRLCDGDFLTGVKWASVDPCEIHYPSELTQLLVNISQNSDIDQINEIFKVSENYQKVVPLDLYLIGKMCEEFIFVPDIIPLIKTIDNLLKINKKVVKESQLKLRATDKILSFIDQIKTKCRSNVKFQLENFAFVSLESNFTGLIIQKFGDNFKVTKLEGYHFLENLTKIDYLESAIWLNPEFTEQLTISVYFNDLFFLQDSMHPSIIFGLINPKTLKNPVNIIHRIKPHHDRPNFCAFWNYNLRSKGFWEKQNVAENKSGFSVCTFWHAANFALIEPEDGVTDDLIDLLNSNVSTTETMQILANISQRYDEFQPIDVKVVGDILEKVSGNNNVDLNYLAEIVSNLQEINREVLAKSQDESQATDLILSKIDKIVQNYRLEEEIQVKSDHFFVVITNQRSDFSGLVLLEDGQIDILIGDFSIAGVINRDNFHSAVMLSSQLKNLIGDTKIIITVFFKSVLFNENNHYNVSKIFGIILGSQDFKYPLTLVYKSDKTKDNLCAFWKFEPNQNLPGFWAVDGEFANYSDIIQCDFFHTTHFANLILDKPLEPKKSSIIDLLSTITNTISFVCLLLIVLTAVIFKRWRQNTGNQILLNLTVNNILQIILFYISAYASNVDDAFFCTALGVTLHYTTVSQFFWMLVIAILQFRKFVIVLEAPPKFVLLKACICGWVFPLFPVLSVLLLNRKTYVESNIGLCYPSDLSLYLGVWTPICIIIIINFIIFVITLNSIFRKKVECFNTRNDDVLYQLRLGILLFFMLGFTWIFGFFAELDFGFIFEYLFCITATLQGFILFLFFVVFNVNTRYLYVSAFKKCMKKL